MEVINRIVTATKAIDEFPVESDFEVKYEDLVVSVKSGCDDIILKNLYVSIDPYQINRMKSFSSTHKTSDFATPIIPAQVIQISIYLSSFYLFNKT